MFPPANHDYGGIGSSWAMELLRNVDQRRELFNGHLLRSKIPECRRLQTFLNHEESAQSERYCAAGCRGLCCGRAEGAASSLQFGRGPVWLLSLLPQRRKAVALTWEGVFASQRLPQQLNLDQVNLRLADLTVGNFSGEKETLLWAAPRSKPSMKRIMNKMHHPHSPVPLKVVPLVAMSLDNSQVVLMFSNWTNDVLAWPSM
jgi:hypothetical protein